MTLLFCQGGFFLLPEMWPDHLPYSWEDVGPLSPKKQVQSAWTLLHSVPIFVLLGKTSTWAITPAPSGCRKLRFAVTRWSCWACQVGFPSLSVGKRTQGNLEIEKIMSNDKRGFLSVKIWQREGVSTAESVSYLPWRLSMPWPAAVHPEWDTGSFIHSLFFLLSSFVLQFFYCMFIHLLCTH